MLGLKSVLSPSSLPLTVIPDWGIAVIVVGVLALVALMFCLIGVCFACQSSKKGEGRMSVCLSICLCRFVWCGSQFSGVCDVGYILHACGSNVL